jgi:hypothetical protein
LRTAKTAPSHRKDERFLKRRAQFQDSKDDRFFKDKRDGKTASPHRKDKRFFKKRRHCQDSAVSSQRRALFKKTSTF